MGKKSIDQFTLLHFAVGVVSYFWGFTFGWFLLIHTLFEYVENTGAIMTIIDKYIKIWPGGKPHKDTLENSVFDTIAAMFGWILASILDNLIEKNKLTISGIINSRHRKMLNLK